MIDKWLVKRSHGTGLIKLISCRDINEMSISWIITIIVLAVIILGLGIIIIIINRRRKSERSNRRTERDNLGKDLADSSTDLEDLKKKLSDVQKILTIQQDDLNAKQDELVKKTADERRKTTELNDCVAREKQLKERLDELIAENAKLGQSNLKLSEQANDVIKISDKLQANIKALDNARKAVEAKQAALDNARTEIDDLKKRLAEATEKGPTVEDVIAKIEGAMMNSWDSSITAYLQQNYETVIKAISSGKLVSTLVEHKWSSARRSNAISNIRHTLIDPVERLQ